MLMIREWCFNFLICHSRIEARDGSECVCQNFRFVCFFVLFHHICSLLLVTERQADLFFILFALPNVIKLLLCL